MASQDHPRLTVTERRDTDACVLEVVGPLDMATDHLLSEPLTRAAQDPTLSVVTVDLSRVSYIDSLGLGVLLVANRELSKRSRRLRVLAPAGSHPERAIRLCRLTGVFEVVETPDADETGTSQVNG